MPKNVAEILAIIVTLSQIASNAAAEGRTETTAEEQQQLKDVLVREQSTLDEFDSRARGEHDA